MSTIIDKLSELIYNSTMSISDISRKSNISRPMIYKIINKEVSSLSTDTISSICNALNVDNSLLFESEKSTNARVKIPVLGTIPAGIPIEAISDILDYEEISEDMASRGEYFALKVRGDSMTPIINDGDVVIIKKQEDADSGKICVVMINGYDATLKEIKKEPNGLWVLPKNPYSDFKATFFTSEEIIKKPVRVIGVAVEIRRSL